MLLQNEEARKKFLIPLRRTHRKKDIEICFDLREEQWVSFPASAQNYTKLKQKLIACLEEDPDFRLKPAEAIFIQNYETFLGMLDLLAETCLGRNLRAQKSMMEFYENKLLTAGFEDRKLNFETRTRTLKLFLALYLDREPF